MIWVTVVWSMSMSACLTLALVHLFIWIRNRRNVVHVLFALTAIGVAGIAIGELQMMLARTPGEFAARLRWTHVPIFFVVVSLVWFVRVYFRAGPLWLAWSVCASRLLALILNFVFAPNLNYSQITGLHRVSVFGSGGVAVPQGVISARTEIGEFSSLLLLAFVVSATATLWRRGGAMERRRAVIVGGSMILFILVASGHVSLIHRGLIESPYIVSLAFLAPVAAMAFDLAADVARSGELVRDLHKAKRDLRETEHLAATAVEVALWRWDVGKDRVWVSDQGRALLGLNGQENIDMNGFMAALVPEDRELARRAVTDALRAGTDHDGEYRIRRSDGTIQWIATRARVELDSGKNPVLLRGICFDITRRKDAEERFRLVVDASPIAMIAVGVAGRITLFNKQAELIFHYAPDQVIGKNIEVLIADRFWPTFGSHLREVVCAPATGVVGSGLELTGRRQDGSEFPIQIRLSVMRAPEGLSVLVSVMDLTELKRGEREEVRHRNELSHLSRVAVLGELSGSLAHELNQPLTAILSNAQAAQEILLSDPCDLDEVRGILEDIVAEDRRAGEVIRRLRALFRKGEVQEEPIDVNELVLTVLKLMNTDLVNHDVRVVSQLRSGLPKIAGDRVQLQQVLINLVLNAIDAMSGNATGGGVLHISTDFDDHGCVRISVKDNGCGIASEEMDQIFEPFHSTKATGMGFGLAICRTIISAHAGRLWAANNCDRGACFCVALHPVTE